MRIACLASLFCQESFLLSQWFSTAAVPHVLVAPSHNRISLLHYNCDFAAVTNRNVNIFLEIEVCQRVPNPHVENYWSDRMANPKTKCGAVGKLGRTAHLEACERGSRLSLFPLRLLESVQSGAIFSLCGDVAATTGRGGLPPR